MIIAKLFYVVMNFLRALNRGRNLITSAFTSSLGLLCHSLTGKRSKVGGSVLVLPCCATGHLTCGVQATGTWSGCVVRQTVEEGL